MSRTASSPLLVCARGLEIVPAHALPPEVRALVGRDGGRYAIFSPRARTAPVLIDAEAAELMEGFRSPQTISKAIISHSQRHDRDPHEVLRERLPLIRRFLAKRFLVVADGNATGPPASTALAPGDRIDDLEIARLLQRTEETEVYQIRTSDGRAAALKLQCGEVPPVGHELEHEERVLRHLDGDPAPRLLRVGEDHGRAYLLLEWCPGADAETAAQEWRRRRGAAGRRRLLRVCRNLADAYGGLHARGIVHGDVHARNVRIDRDDRIRLIDFGLARFSGGREEGDRRSERGGVPLFLEPEAASRLLDGESPPPPTPRGEQYALAALLYQLSTGLPYLDFDLELRAMWRQIVSAPPIAFAERGVAPWPDVEAALARALAKEPAERFPTLAELADRLAAAGVPAPRRRTPTRGATTDPVRQLPDRLLTRVSAEASPDPRGEEPAPRSSLFLGAAGVAYVLFRLALLRRDPSLLSRAHSWLDGAASATEGAEAVLDSPPDPEAGRIDDTSPFHCASGIHALSAMIASAGDRPRRHATAVEAWLTANRLPARTPDLVTGGAGSLLAAALLTESWLESSPADLARVTEVGSRIRRHLWGSPAQEPVVGETLGQIGIAHGWAGVLYATLRWSAVTATAAPTETEKRLVELAELAQPAGRGLIWPWELPATESGRPGFMAGWCSGSAGYVLLFALAADFFPRADFAELALGAGWNAWESSQREGSLCCGLAGRAFAMLRLHRLTGDAVWVDRARDLARIALREGRFDEALPNSLFKGRLGLELLAAELEQPGLARFPLF